LEIQENEHTDYLARIVMGKNNVLKLMQFLCNSIDYGNFKDTIDGTPDQQRKPYHEIWHIMADSLGAYGRKPRSKSQ